jgi:Bacterial Ig-like domain
MNPTHHNFESGPDYHSLLAAPIGVLLVLLILLTSGCGGGGSEAVPQGELGATTLLEGRAADGYLADATVFLDINGNKLPDPDEPQTVTGSGGRFSLEVTTGLEQLYPIVVRVDRSRTFDEETAAVVPYDYTLESPIGRYQFISPLTTLVKQELDKNAVFLEMDAINLVRTRLGISDDISFWQDYIAGAQSGQAAAGYRIAHETARVLAGLHGRLLAELEQNLGGTLQDDDLLPATRVISDLQMQHAGEIANALSGISMAAAKTADQLVDQLVSSIDLTTLDRKLLNRYRRLTSKNPGTWDATPPEILASLPGDGSTVPVTTTIEVAFNENLDPATVTNDAVVLSTDGVRLAGTVSYDKNRLLLTLVPNQPLYAYTDYQVTASPTIADQLGNPLGAAKTWHFQTLFEQSPPVLPDF